jgi:hypothetical protein
MSLWGGRTGLGDAGVREPKASSAVRAPRPDAASPKEKKRVPRKCIVMNKAERARRELGLTELPEPVKKFGEFMLKQSEKEITPRDVVKAYTVTRSSIQRQGQTAEKLREAWPDHPFQGRDIRPEDAFAYLLQSPDGRTYLNEAETGVLTEAGREAARRIAERHKAFGLSSTLYKDLTERAPELAKKSEELGRVLRRGTKGQWYSFARDNIWGIGHAKKGFITALLGRGDMPTADAREIEFWWTNRKKFTPSQEARAMPRFAERLEKSLAELNLETPAELRPFYQHLAHHALWDAVGGTQTTHSDVMSCMLLAGVKKPLTLSPRRTSRRGRK